MAECRGECSRSRDRSLRLECELGQGALIVFDENRSVLEKGTIASPLGAAGELLSVEHELAGGRLVEAGRGAGKRGPPARCGDLCLHAEVPQPLDENTIDAIVRVTEIA